MEMNSLEGIIAVGAGHGIGFSLVEILLKDYSAQKIIATYRDEAKAIELKTLAQEYPLKLKIIKLDPLDEEQLKNFSASLMGEGFALRLLLNTCGFLHDESSLPEKRLKGFSPEYFVESMRVNALITPLLLSTLEPLIPKNEETLFAVLSAKVGSITDNRLGGWYSYRASKAALNMLVKTAAIEFSRSHKKFTLLSIHPGTTETSLSAPFLSGTNYKVHSPQESARNILKVLSQKGSEDSGKFFSWDGAELPW